MELETALTEFFEMRPILAQARMGTYFIIPLRYEAGALRHDRIQALGRPWDVTTMDLSETVKRLFYADDTASIGGCYRIDAEALCQALFGGETALGITGFSVSDKNGCAERLPFSFYHAYLYYFHTRVAFLCLGIGYGDMRVLRWICNLGFAESRADYHYRDAFGQEHGFVLEKQLEEVLRGWGWKAFCTQQRAAAGGVCGQCGSCAAAVPVTGYDPAGGFQSAFDESAERTGRG